jgi:O-acetyl-ADP-ribose deacetylase (regulator of RNase III)
MKIQLIDRNEEMCDQWVEHFKDCDDVIIYNGDFFSIPTDCVVSPANSFGFMGGGLDGVITKRLGTQIQIRVQDEIKRKGMGELLVGQAVLVPTSNVEIPFCISAPTMRVSMPIDGTVNVYLAAKAIFKMLKDNLMVPRIEKVSISGLGTSVGNVPFDVCAKQMRQAYDEIWLGKLTQPTSLYEAKNNHAMLCEFSKTIKDLQHED